MSINFVLFDAALELIPKEIIRHPAILADSKRRGTPPDEILLDRAVHHYAMSGIKNSERRGRPDIVHTTLLVATDSPAYRRGRMKIFVHTYDGKILNFRGGVRPPVNYNNFVNLMAQLIRSGRVPLHGRPLIERNEGSIKTLLESIGGFAILLTSRGRRTEFTDALEKIDQKTVTLLVGGYPKGPPPSELFKLCDDAISIYDSMLASWTVASRVIYDLEKFLLKI
jgi:rRNA small subunit pseudouridine methyltransferase Nep1